MIKDTCDDLALKMADDVSAGRMEKFCDILNRCPELHLTQSCLVQISIYAITLACCSESITPDHSKTGNRTVDLPDQQTCNNARPLPSGKIFGGTEAEEGEFPWLGMLLKAGNFQCECTVLDATHVMTTAHCFDLHRAGDRYEVIVGKYTFDLDVRDITEQRREVTSFIKHEQYDQARYWNDIAILKLASPLEFTASVSPACLPSHSETLGQMCTVAGWGRTQENEPPKVLMKVELQAYDRTQCFNEFNNTAKDLSKFLHDGAICAANGKLGQKDACKGDSGSPLMCIKSTTTSAAWFVFGIVSNGNSCALPGEPGIYINVQYYLSWINATIHAPS
ncbi:hypothetical protein BsWGS_16111 [Bradybaena similaris]